MGKMVCNTIVKPCFFRACFILDITFVKKRYVLILFLYIFYFYIIKMHFNHFDQQRQNHPASTVLLFTWCYAATHFALWFYFNKFIISLNASNKSNFKDKRRLSFSLFLLITFILADHYAPSLLWHSEERF